MNRKQRLRFLKFALVGGMGVAVQLGALTLLAAMKVNYLAATGLAVEAAVVHNFLWHRRFTWADRAMPEGKACQSEAWKRLFRFQVSNGGISVLGNLLLMRGLVGLARVPLWLRSLVGIAICSWGNFLAGDQWVFAEDGESVGAPSEVG